MKNLITRFKNDESGVTAIEYGLIAGLIAVAIIGVLGTTETSLSGIFTAISDALDTAAAGT